MYRYVWPQVDVVSTMKDVLAITQSLVSRKVLLVDAVGDVPSIVADADRLVQIMYNLIGNAGGDACAVGYDGWWGCGCGRKGGWVLNLLSKP